MKNKAADSDRPFGKLTRIKDFLPPPYKLVIPEETSKVTICLKKSDVAFFKRMAKQYHTKYQKMIRELVSKYTEQYSQTI
ncbi:CopG family transcriptional regulator [bacterium]|nr:CopG family transcriptional regulator [Candidatus Omnitrophota bacterium]MBU2528833.1 CopG family transcriptional regulator [bacterium]MBU3930680.1 CopG family transcriptional regulator [bacterium]MBU4122158.1 CopG family transcriptional regulator [bacterium]